MSERIIILIDGGYLDAALRDQFNHARISYPKFVAELAQDHTVLRTYYYTCEPWQNNPPTEDDRKRISNAQKFREYLQRIPNFEVRLGRLAYRGVSNNGSVILEQKQVDILLALELARMSMKRAINRAILVTGDSDFVPAINLAKDEGIEVFLAHADRPHISLINAVDQIIKIDSKMIQRIKSEK